MEKISLDPVQREVAQKRLMAIARQMINADDYDALRILYNAVAPINKSVPRWHEMLTDSFAFAIASTTDTELLYAFRVLDATLHRIKRD